MGVGALFLGKLLFSIHPFSHLLEWVPLAVWKLCDCGRRAGVGAMDTFPSLPGPSQLPPPPRRPQPHQLPRFLTRPVPFPRVALARANGEVRGPSLRPEGLLPAPAHTWTERWLQEAPPLPGLGLAVVTAICASWEARSGGLGHHRCHRLSDPGTPTQGLSLVALTSVPPVPRVCGFGYQVQGRGAW